MYASKNAFEDLCNENDEQGGHNFENCLGMTGLGLYHDNFNGVPEQQW